MRDEQMQDEEMSDEQMSDEGMGPHDPKSSKTCRLNLRVTV
jgi:hypothetical protein